MNIKNHIAYTKLSLILQAIAAVIFICSVTLGFLENNLYWLLLEYCLLGLLQVAHTIISIIYSELYGIKRWHLYYLLVNLGFMTFSISNSSIWGLLFLLLTSPIVAAIFFIVQWKDLKQLMNTNTHDLQNNIHNDE